MLQTRRKHLQIAYVIKDLYPEYIKNSYNSIIRKQIIQLKNRQRIEIDIFPKNTNTKYKCPLNM